MTLSRRRIAALAFIGLPFLAACGSSPTGPGFDISGSWTAQHLVIGSRLTMTLSGEGNVTGTGTYALEAGRSGTLTVVGTYNAPNAVLTFTYDYGPVATYSATVQNASQMTGSIQYQGDSGTGQLTFTRP